MNRSELEAKLKSEKVSLWAYDLENVGKDETFCLEKTDSGWSVYYRERGNRNGEREFKSEAEACAYLLEEILRDPATRL